MREDKIVIQESMSAFVECLERLFQMWSQQPDGSAKYSMLSRITEIDREVKAALALGDQPAGCTENLSLLLDILAADEGYPTICGELREILVRRRDARPSS